MLNRQNTNRVGILLSLNILSIFIDGLGFGRIRLYLDILVTISFLFVLVFSLKPMTKMGFLIILILLLIIGIIFSNENYSRVIISDLGTYCLICSVLIIKELNLKFFSTFFQIIVFIVVIYYTYSLQKIDITLIQSGQAFNRRDAFSALDVTVGDSSGLYVYKAQTLLNPILYFYLFLLPISFMYVNKYLVTFLAIICLILVFIYSLYYQKRHNLVEITFIIVIIFTLYSNFLPSGLKYSRFSSVIIGVSILYYLYHSPYLINIFDRFNNEIDNGVENFSRLREFTNVREEFVFFNYIFGMGLGSSTTKAYSAGANLHIGFFNLIFKGGITLFLFILSMLIRSILFYYKRLRVNPLYPIGLALTLFSIMSLSVSPGYGIYPGTFFIGLALFSRHVVSKFKL